MAFGHVLRERRHALGFTQVDLEAISRVGRSYISELESGRKQPCLRPLLQLAHALRLSPQELLSTVVERIDPQVLAELTTGP